jgi:hypothetical protein
MSHGIEEQRGKEDYKSFLTFISRALSTPLLPAQASNTQSLAVTTAVVTLSPPEDTAELQISADGNFFFRTK